MSYNIMQYTIIGEEHLDSQFSLQEFSQVICSSMASRKSLLLQRNFLNRKMQLLFRSCINLPRIRSTTPVLTQFTGTIDHIVFELSVGLNEGAGLSEQLTTLMQKPDNQISSLLLLNQMSLRQTEGKFMFSHRKGFIFRLDLSLFRFLRDQRKLKVYITQKIQKIYSLFSNELQRLFIFLRGKGQGSTSKGLIEQEEKLKMLKEVLQKQRQFRPKSTKINLSGCTDKTIPEVLDLSFKTLKTKKVKPTELLQSEKIYNEKVEQMMKETKESTTAILQGMRIKSVCKPEMALCQGGFSKISRGIFDIELFGSVNQESMVLVEQKQNFPLVIKQHKKKEDYQALLNQQRFLVFARNHHCSYIGQYFSQAKNSSYFQNGIYLQHYPNTIGENIHINQRQLLKILTEVAQGLSFLNDIGVAHRDIKLHNIMIDRQRKARIIDFGSAASIIWTGKCRNSSFVSEMDTRLASTEGYYLPYKQAALKCISLGDKFTKEQYECHQNFDMFSFGVVLTKKMCLNLPCVGDFIREQLYFMSKKCLQPNPDDRITPIEAAIWLKCLQQYEWQRRCVWNYAQHKARQLERGTNNQ